MDELALRTLVASLEASRSSDHWWLEFCTALVAIGVLFEVIFVLWEYVDELHDFRRGVVHTPEKPSMLLFAVGLLGAGLVAIGVAGEFRFEARIESKETHIRKANDELFLLLSKQAGEAAASAKTAHDEADAVKTETDELTIRLGNAAKQVGILEQDVRVQGPRWRLLEENKASFIEALKPFAGQRFTVVKCGLMSPAEQEKLEQDLLNFLGKQGAGWAMESPGYARWTRCTAGASSVGGNLVIFSSTADKSVKDAAGALDDSLNKIEISTIIVPSLPEGRQLEIQFLGDDSPWELAAKDPTAVILLVGSNPMFDLAGWKKRHKK
jgi:hypothetical protein